MIAKLVAITLCRLMAGQAKGMGSAVPETASLLRRQAGELAAEDSGWQALGFLLCRAESRQGQAQAEGLRVSRGSSCDDSRRWGNAVVSQQAPIM